MRLRLAHHIDCLLNSTTRLAAWAVLALALLTAALVIGKKLGLVSNAGEELKWHLFAFAWLAACGKTWRLGGHVCVDVLSARWPARHQNLVRRLSMVMIGLPIVAVVAWFGTLAAWQAWEHGEQSLDAGGLGQRWAIRACLPAGFVLLGLAMIADLISPAHKPNAKPTP